MKYHDFKIMKTEGNVQSIPYTIIYRRGARMITLRIDRKGDVRVSAPYYASKREIERLILNNKDKLSRGRPQKRLWMDGEELVFAGRSVHLHFVSVPGKVSVSEDELLVPSVWKANVQDKVKELYRESTRSRVIPLVGAWCGKLGLSVGRITIRDTHRVWASCSRLGNLNFSLRCAGLDDSDLSYLVLHELSHRVHFNHGPKFHAYLDTHMSDWREHEKHLKNMQEACDVFGD